MREAEQVEAERVERGDDRPHSKVELVPFVRHRIHQVLLQHPRPVGYVLLQPGGRRLIVRHVLLCQRVHVDAHLVEAALRLEDPDPVALEPLVVEREVVSAEPFVWDLKKGARGCRRRARSMSRCATLRPAEATAARKVVS